MQDRHIEFVHITARMFRAGRYPFTAYEFMEHSCELGELIPESLVPYIDESAWIRIKIFEHEGDRLAPTIDWWSSLGDLWTTEIDLDENYKLKSDTIRLKFLPMTVGKYTDDRYSNHVLCAGLVGLIEYNCFQSLGAKDTFKDSLDEIMQLLESVGINNYDEIKVLTEWSCFAGEVHGGLDSDYYDENWYLIGNVVPSAKVGGAE